MQNSVERLNTLCIESFDMVIMRQNSRVLKQTKQALEEVTRIGKKAIVTIPNFGYWSTRLSLLFSGKMPVTGSLPNNWYNTPNIHLCTIKDFEILCEQSGINILEKRFFNSNGGESVLAKVLPNIFAATAMYKISK